MMNRVSSILHKRLDHPALARIITSQEIRKRSLKAATRLWLQSGAHRSLFALEGASPLPLPLPLLPSPPSLSQSDCTAKYITTNDERWVICNIFVVVVVVVVVIVGPLLTTMVSVLTGWLSAHCSALTTREIAVPRCNIIYLL